MTPEGPEQCDNLISTFPFPFPNLNYPKIKAFIGIGTKGA